MAVYGLQVIRTELQRVLKQHYTLHNRVVPPQCQSQAWMMEEGDGKRIVMLMLSVVKLTNINLRAVFTAHIQKSRCQIRID